MKKFAILAAVVALIGCTQNDEGLDNITSTPEKSQTEFYASMPECDTRTYVEDNKYLRWNAGDEITVFAGNSYNGHWQFAGEDGANSGKFNEISEGGFVTGTPLDLTANYAIYPYDENISISEAGVVSLTLPAVQEYNHTYANSFGAGANTMMAVTKNTSDNFLAFKNLCGYLKLKFYGNDVTVKSITVKGNNGEKIAGPATVSMAYGDEPTITMGNDATDTITIDCGEGVALSNEEANPTIFWVVIPEITFEGGITIEVTDINDQIFEKKTTNAVPIENNLIQPMAALGVEVAPAGPANNEIWYTATSKVEPYDKTVFGANYVSNEWDSATGMGVITFDGEITSIGEYAFWDRTSLTSIIIPESVTVIGESAFKYCSIQDVTLPENLERIRSDAFEYCRNLTSITIPPSVVSIGSAAFASCDNLTAFYGKYASEDNRCLIYDGLAAYGKIYLVAFAPKDITEYAIPEEVTIINEYAFADTELEYVIIPDGVKTIELHAFSRCRNLKSVVIGRGVTEIDSFAFEYCEYLECICLKSTTPPRVRDLFEYYYDGEPVFYVPIESIDDYKADSEWSEIIASYNIEGSHFATTSEIHYTSSDGNIVEPRMELVGAKIISNTYKDGKGVIELFGYVMKLVSSTFDNCSNLASISLPSSVTSLGSCTFYNCPNLTSAIIPESVNFMDSWVFSECMNINEIYFKAQNPPILDHPVFFEHGLTPRIYVPSNSVSAYKNADNWTYWANLIVGYNFE